MASSAISATRIATLDVLLNGSIAGFNRMVKNQYQLSLIFIENKR
jgi:hypothetical protein